MIVAQGIHITAAVLHPGPEGARRNVRMPGGDADGNRSRVTGRIGPGGEHTGDFHIHRDPVQNRRDIRHLRSGHIHPNHEFPIRTQAGSGAHHP